MKRKTIRILVLRTAGTNCDMETVYACHAAGGDPELVHVNRLIRGERKMRNYHILVIPGGFSYGDDVSAGRILANEMRYKIGSEIKEFIKSGKPVLGICNGFQVLVKTGLLPGLTNGSQENNFRQQATLFNNDSGRFECRWIYLKRLKNSPCIFTRGLEQEIIALPVAHGEGKVMFDSDATRRKVWENNQVVFQYVDKDGKPVPYPHNPNGSVDDIAGLCDPTGLIFGLMPHPERHIFPYHHPRWTRGEASTIGDGLPIFQNAINYARKNL